MFTIEMLPADEGDALWIEYGSKPVRRILIDCGRKTAYRAIVKRLGRDFGCFELFVLTHVDADHITGAVPLLQDDRFGRGKVKDIWFNGWFHLNGQRWDSVPRTAGAQQGEFFSALLRDRDYPWNEAFKRMPAVIPDAGPLPRFELDGGMVLTLLGPTTEKLEEMRTRWEEDLAAAVKSKRIEPGDYERALEVLGKDGKSGPDTLGHGPRGPIVIADLLEIPFKADPSEPNGSTISFLAEHDGVGVLFAGDAHAAQVEGAVRRLLKERGLKRLPLAALKMSHHGSASNTSSELLELLDCPRFLVSTDGTRHHHPDPQTLARVLHAANDPVEFHFNYRSDENEAWDDDRLRRENRFKTFYPAAREGGLKVSLEARRKRAGTAARRGMKKPRRSGAGRHSGSTR